MQLTDYKINGKHADMLEALIQSGIFEYYWQVYVASPILGLKYKRKATRDNSNVQQRTIFLDQLNKRADVIDFIYRLIVLADENHEPNPKERIQKAFSIIGTDEAKPDEQLFHEYLLGGIEILHEKLIDKGTDQINNIGEFLDELNIGDNSLTEEFGINILSNEVKI